LREACQEFTGNKKVKYCADTNGAEISCNQSFPETIDVWYPSVERQDDRRTAEEQNRNGEEDVTPSEIVPRADGAEIKEDGEVEKTVDGRLERVVERGKAEPVVQSEHISYHPT
jgi:hypothetical protein